MKLFRKAFLLMFALVTIFSVAACQYETDTIVIGEGDWNSNRFYNQVVKYILENGYDETVEVTSVSTPILIQSLTDGSIDLNIETWSDNMPTYQQDILDGNYVELGVNFDDNFQGIYIPQYLQDEHPDLVSISDLANYKSLFPDPEVTGWDAENDKGVIYGGPSSWQVTTFFINKFANTDLYPELAANFEFRTLESTATLNSTLTAAYESEEAWAGYNWEPTSIMGRYDMVLLEDDIAYDYDTGAGLIPTNNVTIVSTANFEEAHADAAAFLKLMNTSSAMVNEVLAYMDEQGLDPDEVAIWWLQNNESIWSTWVSDDALAKINTALDAE